MEHLKGFSPVCMRSWHLRFEDLENDAKQMEHLKGFSPVCMRSCPLRLEDWVNDLKQMEQQKGFSPECMPSWDLRCEDRENDFKQMEQLNGFSPECMRSCCRRFSLTKNDFEQSAQLNGFSAEPMLPGVSFSSPGSFAFVRKPPRFRTEGKDQGFVSETHRWYHVLFPVTFSFEVGAHEAAPSLELTVAVLSSTSSFKFISAVDIFSVSSVLAWNRTAEPQKHWSRRRCLNARLNIWKYVTLLISLNHLIIFFRYNDVMKNSLSRIRDTQTMRHLKLEQAVCWNT